MAVWRKVIVSGSQANLNTLQVDNLTSGQVVIGGGQGSNLSTTAINGTGNIVATTGASGLSASGSFSGSFTGNGAGLTGVVATNAYALTFGEGLGLTAQGASGSYNGNSPVTLTVSGAVDLTDNIITKWDNTNNKFAVSSLTDNGTTITGTTSIRLSGANASLTGSFTGNLTGSATTASYVTGSIFTAGNLATSASFAVSASYITGSVFTGPNAAATASYITGSVFTGANSAATASYITGSILTGANSAATASYVTASIFGTGNTPATASFALTASYAANGGTLVNSLFAGLGLSGSSPSFNGSAAVTFSISGSAQLSTNNIPRWSGTGLTGSSITDTGTAVTILNPTTFSSNVTVNGNILVAGTASFQNTDSLFVADRFIAIASGSTSLTQAGIIAINGSGNSGMSGSAFFLDTQGTYGRWAVTASLNSTASGITPVINADEYMVTAKINNGAPAGGSFPTWGGNSNNAGGNMWIDTSDTKGGIYIWA